MAKWNEADRKMAHMLYQAIDRSYYMESLGFRCFPWQKAVLDSEGKRKVINGARQSGKSTIVSGVPCHTARFCPGSISIIGAPTENQANETMSKVIGFCRSDPDYPKMLKCSNEEIKLENGSRIIVRPAKSDTFRGYSCPRVIVLDEASRIEEDAYTSGARPMLTDNPEGELYLISTPFGREGFFYRAMTEDNAADVWERYEVRSPWHVVGAGSETYLEPFMDEDEYRRSMEAKGIKAWFSPRHRDFGFQTEQLAEMGKTQYLQEYETEFVEKAGQVFSYDDIEAMFRHGDDIQPFREKMNQVSGSGVKARSFAV